MPYSFLLIAPDATAQSVAETLRREFDAAVEIAPQRRAGLARLRREEFSLVLLDEGLAAADPEATAQLYASAGAAPVQEVSFVLSSAPRILRQARAALARRDLDRAQGHAAAAALLQAEFGGALAGILLASELALREAPPAQQPRVRHLVELAGGLRNRLRA